MSSNLTPFWQSQTRMACLKRSQVQVFKSHKQMQQGAQVQRSSALTITQTLVHFGNTRVTSPGHSADQMCPFPQWICRSRAEEKRTLLPGQCRLNLGNPSDRKVNISTFSVFISVEYQTASNKQLCVGGKMQWPVAHVQFSFTVGQHIFTFRVAHRQATCQ